MTSTNSLMESRGGVELSNLQGVKINQEISPLQQLVVESVCSQLCINHNKKDIYFSPVPGLIIRKSYFLYANLRHITNSMDSYEITIYFCIPGIEEVKTASSKYTNRSAAEKYFQEILLKMQE